MQLRRSRLSVRFADSRLEERIAPVTQLLPDLQIVGSILNGWTIKALPGGGQEIRFATGLANNGTGAFELNGTSTIITESDGSTAQLVNQRIYLSDGTFTTRPAGEFYYDEDCGDMHFEEMALARLLLRPNGTGVGGVVASNEKDGFCLIDTGPYNPSLPGYPATAQYKTCGAQIQGISVGWMDVYSSVIDGQSVNITGVPNGDYWLEVIADPVNHILETDETNNATRIPITLSSQPTYGFRVLDAVPIGATNTALSSATLTFNQAVNISSFVSSNFILNGPLGAVPISSATLIDPSNVRVNFAAQTTVGTYTLNVLGGVMNASGQKLDQNNNGTGGEVADTFSFVFTLPAPKLVDSTPSSGVAGPVSKVRVRYNKPITSSSFTIADIVSFTGPSGNNLLGSVTSVTPAATTGTSTVFDLQFNAQTTPGIYRLTIAPTVSDPLGHTVDQNLDGVSNAADNYVVTFAVSALNTVGPDDFGYVATSSAVSMTSIVGRTGTFTIANNLDDAAPMVNLGANTFNFYGVTYTGADMLWVSTNGLLTFGSGASNYAFVNDELTHVVLPTHAVLWDDWAPGASPQVIGLFEDTSGDSIPDRLIIEWNQVKHTLPGANDNGVSFQTVLELNTGSRAGTIINNYFDLDTNNANYSNGASATVGIRAAGDGASQVQVSFNSATNPLVQSGKSIQFSVPRVQSIAALTPSPNGTGEGLFQVTFSHAVTGVDAADFKLNKTGAIIGEWIDSVAPTADAKVWNVHYQWYRGAGTIRLAVNDNDTITSLYGARLGGLGLDNGSFDPGVSTTLNEPNQIRVVVGADAGGGPHVRVLKASTGTPVFSFFAFDAGFRGGVRVAQADVNGDGTPDIIAAAGPGGGPHVKVFDGRDLHLLTEFFAYSSTFLGGVYVASGDVNNDGKADIITGADSGGGPHVRVISGANGRELMGFFAYAPTFVGGVRVAAGDFNNDGRADIITGAGPGGGPHVQIFSGANGSVLRSFFAYDATATKGVFVAAGDVNADNKLDIVTGYGGNSQVRVFSNNGTLLQSYLAISSANKSVRVGCVDINNDGRADVWAAAGPGDAPIIECRDATSLTQLQRFNVFDPSFLGGVYVGS